MKKKRKIIQISSTPCVETFEGDVRNLYALCDDGSLWDFSYDGRKMKWEAINVSEVEDGVFQ